MSQSKKTLPDRIEEYWDWFAVALFLLVTVDLFTSVGAAVEVGLAHEANPFMRWVLGQGPFVLMGVNLLVVFVAIVAFSGVLSAVRGLSDPYDRVFELLVEIWLGSLIGVGLFLFANNFAVIVLGESLVG
ncbi:MAG: DUF5658 family protein [Halodesulfurarchaeum sp.]